MRSHRGNASGSHDKICLCGPAARNPNIVASLRAPATKCRNTREIDLEDTIPRDLGFLNINPLIDLAIKDATKHVVQPRLRAYLGKAVSSISGLIGMHSWLASRLPYLIASTHRPCRPTLRVATVNSWTLIGVIGSLLYFVRKTVDPKSHNA